MAEVLAGKGSWFGGPNDSTDSGHTANGETTKTPGIAVYNHATLGGYWRVTAPNGKSVVLKQTDIGPAPWTGRKIDVTYSALGNFGYKESNFPTDSGFKAEYLGHNSKGAASSIPGIASTAPAAASGASFNQAAYGQAQKRAVLANLLKSEGQSARNNPLFASGLLSGKTPERPEFVRGGKGSGPAALPTGATSASPLAGPPGNPNLKPTKNPKIPINLKEAAAHIEIGRDKVAVPKGGFGLPSLGAPDYLAEQLNHPVIAVHPAGNVVKTDKGPVFMPHKRIR